MAGKKPKARKINYVSRFLKYSLFFSNFLFWLVGLVITAIGVLAYIETGGIQGSKNLLSVILNFSIIFIGVGVIICIISFCGAIGALRENVCLLRIFAIVIFIIFLSECALVGVGFYLRSQTIATLETVYLETMITNYREPGFADNTNFVDWIQKELRCCGAKTYKDWNRNLYFNCSNVKSQQSCSVPYSCCMKMNNIDKNIINMKCGFNAQKSADVAKTIWQDGCVGNAVRFIESNVIPIVGAVIGIAIIQLVAIFMARNLMGQIQDQIFLLRRTGQR